jgi:CRP-like cAMP-binding protein
MTTRLFDRRPALICTPKQNRILASLPYAEYSRLLPCLELVRIPVGGEISAPDTVITHLYFPVDCVIARLYHLENGAGIKTSVTGYEGMSEISYLLGSEKASACIMALSGGQAFRIEAPLLKKEFDSRGTLHRLLLQFMQALLIQTERLAVSNHYLTIEQRLCQFLLMILDRSPGNQLHITHEQVSILLGVRRESITLAAKKLEAAEAIRYRRGHITIMNRKKLEKLAGDNYTPVCSAYAYLHEVAEPD